MLCQTTFAGLDLRSPLVAGASPLAMNRDHLCALRDEGIGAVVMPSIFEEQLSSNEQVEAAVDGQTESSDLRFPESITRASDLDSYNGGPQEYLQNINNAVAITKVPVIANISCFSTGPWMQYARQIESAGAAAIELNLYHYESNPHRFPEDVERELLNRVEAMRDYTALPIIVKLLPQYTCLANFAYRLSGAGARGICLFGKGPILSIGANGRWQYRWPLTNQRDANSSLDAIRQVHAANMRLHIIASGGIHVCADAITALELGACAVALTSAIHKSGCSVIGRINRGIERQLRATDYRNLREFIGRKACGFDNYPEATRRRNYTQAIVQVAPKNDATS